MNFPTDPVTLAALDAACRCDNEDGRGHLFEFLEFGAEVAERELLSDPDSQGAPIYEVTYKPGREPHSPQTVILSLIAEIERLRAAERSST